MKILLSCFILFCLTACGSVDINIYENNQPTLVLNQFFNGELSAHGILKNRSGEVSRYFNVTMTGSWDDEGIGTLAEKFIFDDNSIEFRTWTFTPTLIPGDKNNNFKSHIQYQASAEDTLAATMIDLSGNTFFMNYDLLINYQSDEIAVNIDDKMYLINDNVMINESVMRKYGIEVGYITLTIIKHSD